MEFNVRNTEPIFLVYGSIVPEDVPNILKRSDLHGRIENERLIIYKGRDNIKHGRKRKKTVEDNLQKRKYNGTLSAAARKYVMKKSKIWVETILNYNNENKHFRQIRKSHPVFITLTLPTRQRHQDTEIKRKCLVPFLDKLRYNNDIKYYLWRAERQKNGNIHFHIIIDKYISRATIHRFWTTCLDRLNYMKEYNKKHPNKSDFTVKLGSLSNPNVYVYYLLKYCLKSDDTQKIQGHVWGMSDELRNIDPLTIYDTRFILECYKYLTDKKMCKVKEFDHYIICEFNTPLLEQSKLNIISSAYRQYLRLLYHLLFKDRHRQDVNYNFQQTYNMPNCCIDSVVNHYEL